MLQINERRQQQQPLAVPFIPPLPAPKRVHHPRRCFGVWCHPFPVLLPAAVVPRQFCCHPFLRPAHNNNNNNRSRRRHNHMHSSHRPFHHCRWQRNDERTASRVCTAHPTTSICSSNINSLQRRRPAAVAARRVCAASRCRPPIWIRQWNNITSRRRRIIPREFSKSPNSKGVCFKNSKGGIGRMTEDKIGTKDIVRAIQKRKMKSLN